MGTLTQKINLQATLVLFLFGPKETPKKQALALGFLITVSVPYTSGI